MPSRRILPTLLLVVVAATCTSLPPTAPPAEMSGASADRAGRHLGFDTHIYPGDAALRTWKSASPYEWVGYYLQAPCRRDPSWSGKRQLLTDMGWGLTVIYVGQQWWTEPPKSAAARQAIARGEATCANFRLTAAQGRIDADDAVARMLAEGFPSGTTIFLDLEYMDRVPEAMRQYYGAWVSRVLADGRYRPGIYVHTRNARQVHTDVSDSWRAAGMRGEPPFWVAGGRAFSHDRYPHEAGHAFASVWQGVLDIHETWGGRTILVDVNVAAHASPSLPGSDAYHGD